MELLIVLAIVIVIAVILIGIYNGLVAKRNRVDEALGQIEVQLKRRWDLIPNLVSAVKGYMGFEQDVLTRVTEARAGAVAAGAQAAGDSFTAESRCMVPMIFVWASGAISSQARETSTRAAR